MEELLQERRVVADMDVEPPARIAGVLRPGAVLDQHRAAVARRGRPRPAAGLTLVVVLGLVPRIVSCSNYEFRPDADGRVEIGDLIRDLETRDPGEPQYLQQTTWVPLIFCRLRRFHRTEKIAERNMPSGGYTYAERISTGPLGLFWVREDVVHRDVDGEEFHREGRGGVGQRLVAWYDHRVATAEGEFAYQRVEFLFGLLKSERQGYPERFERSPGLRPAAAGEGKARAVPPDVLE